ncbi:MAG TPA: putative lipopolysaccharide heptosyltransferase III [Burkholderiales bacterium]|nr:putative lipopolysaccharide heptosyltransferase III [Burkholderiales bacterium]
MQQGPADAIDVSALNRALVVKLRHHGDVLLATPVFGVLGARAPRMAIDALVYDDTAPMLAGMPGLAELHTVGRAWRGLGAAERLAREWRLYSELRERRYDLIVHLSEHPRGAWLARALRARYAVAPALPGRGRLWAKSFSHLYALPRNGRRHAVELNLDALRRIGIQPGHEERRVRFVPGAEAEARVEALLAERGLAARGFIHMHPASRWRFKCWPAEQNAELIGRLAGEGQRIVLTSAPSAEEVALIDDIVARAADKVLNLAGKLSVKELGALTGRARLFVGVDSMPMHLAAAMGTPTVALFGPSGELDWGPWNVAHRVVVASDYSCRPCGNDGCGGGKLSECLTTLAVDTVHAAAASLLAETAA